MPNHFAAQADWPLHSTKLKVKALGTKTMNFLVLGTKTNYSIKQRFTTYAEQGMYGPARGPIPEKSSATVERGTRIPSQLADWAL